VRRPGATKPARSASTADSTRGNGVTRLMVVDSQSREFIHTL
jgi:hypothetical protein